MVTTACDLNVSGYYIEKAKIINQTGKLVYYPDGKIIGVIRDCNGVNTDNKSLLGSYQSSDFSVTLIEIPAIKLNTTPRIYSLTSQNFRNNQIPMGSYLGFWYNVIGFPIDESIKDAITGNRIALNPGLEDVPIKLFRQIWFAERILKKVETKGHRLNQRSRLKFSLV